MVVWCGQKTPSLGITTRRRFVMPNSDPRTDFSIRTSHSWKILIIFLGRVVSGERIEPSPINIATIVDWPKPKTAKHTRQCEAMGSYYRRYIRDFVTMVRPVVELIEIGKRFFVWGEAWGKAFNTIKKALVSTDIMSYPLNEACEFILDVGASDAEIGSVLHQVQGDKEDKQNIIAYAITALQIRNLWQHVTPLNMFVSIF